MHIPSLHVTGAFHRPRKGSNKHKNSINVLWYLTVKRKKQVTIAQV